MDGWMDGGREGKAEASKRTRGHRRVKRERETGNERRDCTIMSKREREREREREGGRKKGNGRDERGEER